MKQMRLSAKLTLGFGCLTLVLLVLGMVGYYSSSRNAKAINEIGIVRLPALQNLDLIRNQDDIINAALRTLINLSISADTRQSQFDTIAQARRTYETASMDYEAAPKTAAETAAWKDLKAAWNAWEEDINVCLGMVRKYDEFATPGQAPRSPAQLDHLEQVIAAQALHACRLSQASENKAMDRLMTLNAEHANSVAKAASTQAAFFKMLMLATTMLGLIGGIALTGLFTCVISKPIKAVVDAMSDGADQTASAAAELASASQVLSEGACEQSASLEETSSSLEEISNMTRRNADSAKQAKDLASQAHAAADNGAAGMREMASAMEAIKSCGSDIANIIKTIDDIAFQTNILALNAAVEAARAEEAGVGFAVVAEEVRNLAQRSAQAAKETAAKIQGAIDKTEFGVQVSNKIAHVLHDIVAKIGLLDDRVAEVAATSREQSQSLEQVNAAVSQMDKVTQSNAASAEETASAAEELDAQAGALKEAVSKLFGLVDGTSRRQQGTVDYPALPPRRAEWRSKPSVAKVLNRDCSRSKAAAHNGIHGNGRCRKPVPPFDTPGTCPTAEADLPMEEFRDF
ncbi:MAG: methyl-accepting chemotaxis protein [Candidatus Omnitrophica bacterium]|nr:methyl-accepting chemotaxis protein [Candidatus Omnitrophota bacterium]